MSNDSNTKFGGIFGKLGSLVFTDEYLQKNASDEEENQAKPRVSSEASQSVSMPSPSYTTPPPIPVSGNVDADKALLDKMYTLLDNLNEPGIDFMEFWDTLEAMGGTTPTNVQNAFVALKIASGNTLTKEFLIQKGNQYCSTLKSKLDEDVNNKLSEKKRLEADKQSQNSSLRAEVQDLENQIKSLQEKLASKQKDLNDLDSKYVPKMQEIDMKIQKGQNAANVVLNEMTTIIQSIETNLK